MRYLTDRRPMVGGALKALNITTLQAHEMPNLSAASVEDLYALPNVPLTSLTPEQLVRFAQIVDTALFKSYLLVRPVLVASLCRSGNWCEISEVEEVLRSREVSALLTHVSYDADVICCCRNSQSLSTFTTAVRCTTRRWIFSRSESWFLPFRCQY